MQRLPDWGKADKPSCPPSCFAVTSWSIWDQFCEIRPVAEHLPDCCQQLHWGTVNPPRRSATLVSMSGHPATAQTPMDETFATINPQAVAAGSIAQTHRATLVDGREVAVKCSALELMPLLPRISPWSGVWRIVARTELGQNEITLCGGICHGAKSWTDFARSQFHRPATAI